MALEFRFIRCVPIKQMIIQTTSQPSTNREFNFHNAISWSYFHQGGLRPIYNPQCAHGMMGSGMSTAKYSKLAIVLNDLH